VLSRVLAYRPASVLNRLPPRSDACPLSLRDLLDAAPAVKLPSLEAGSPAAARAVLVAAKVLHSTVGLSLPRGQDPGPWFREVAVAADELAAGLPLFLSGEVALEDEGAIAVERATSEVWRLVETGLTHVTVDASAVAPEERGRVLAEVAAPLRERELGFDAAVRVAGEPGAGRRALSMIEDLRRRGARPDAISVAFSAPPDAETARGQLGVLDRLSAALRDLPVLRRGPVSPALLAFVRSSALRGCSDGGAAARASGLDGADGAGAQESPDSRARRERWQARAEEMLGPDGADRLEARAYVEAAEFIEALGAGQSAVAVAEGLERRRREDLA
jgi:hypothetical protein